MTTAGDQPSHQEVTGMLEPGVHRFAYHPEHERYGGRELMPENEQLFELSSRLVLAFLRREPSTGARALLALRATVCAARALGDDPAEQAAFYDHGLRAWRTWAAGYGYTERQLDELYGAARPTDELRTKATGGDTPGPLAPWQTALTGLSDRIRRQTPLHPAQVTISHVHMLHNRLGLRTVEEYQTYARLARLFPARPPKGHPLRPLRPGAEQRGPIDRGAPMSTSPTTATARAGAPPTPAVVARAIGVTRHYGDTVALDNVDFTVREGEFIGLLGPNGAGKTTLLNSLLGLRKPTSGRIELFGGAPTNPASLRFIGVTPQESGVPPTLRVAEAVDFVAAHFEETEDRDELLERFDLTKEARRQAGGLSGGQKRRLALALAFVGRPRLVILDEPTTGLDVESRRMLWDRIREFHEGGGTVLLTTHYLEEIEALAKRVVVIAQGHIRARQRGRHPGDGPYAARVHERRTAAGPAGRHQRGADGGAGRADDPRRRSAGPGTGASGRGVLRPRRPAGHARRSLPGDLPVLIHRTSHESA